MDQRFLDETVSRRGALFAAMVDFNSALLRAEPALSPLSEKHDAVPALLNDASILRAYRKAARPAEASPCFWDFSEESRRLILFKAQELEHLALCFSAAVHAEEMALILDKNLVLELRALLGDEIFSYALRRGRYQIGSIRGAILAHGTAAPLAERLVLLARAVLLLMSEGWPEELRRLWLAKLSETALFSATPPQGEGTALTQLPQLSREQRRALWFTLKKILLREAAPQWAPCFD